MSWRPALATLLTCALIATSAPKTAHAEEQTSSVEHEAPRVAPPEIPRIFLTPSESVALAPSLPGLLPSTNGLREIRLSSEAKTWIIVGAIVGGILLIAGVIVLAKPFKKP